MGLRLLRKFKNLKESIIKTDRRDILLKQLPKSCICAEIGVYKGKFSERIIELTNPKKLILVDAWDISVIRDNSDSHKSNTQYNFDLLYSHVYNKFKHKNIVEIIRKNSNEALESFTDGYFDWIYIDASHNYEDVLNDLELSRLKCKKDGIIAGDDYVDAKGKWGTDVIRAVDDFAKKYRFHIESINDQFIIKLS